MAVELIVPGQNYSILEFYKSDRRGKERARAKTTVQHDD